nr:gag pol polyprotein [Hymenolepis microstoma]
MNLNVLRNLGDRISWLLVPTKVATLLQSQERDEMGEERFILRDKMAECTVYRKPSIYAVKKPLQPPYDGPYKVLQRNPKYFILDRSGTKDSVSIDRLKPAYLEPPPTPAPEVRAHLPRPPTQTTEATIPPPSLPTTITPSR